MSSETNPANPEAVQHAAGAGAPQPPVAKRHMVEHVIHGERRTDDYAWLREKKNPEVIACLEAENAYTDAVVKGTEAFQETLYQEMLGRIQQTDLSVPYRLRGYLYFTRTEEGKQYPIHCRRRDAEGSPEDVLLDLNELARGHAFMSLGTLEVSDDNRWLAYSTDTTGFRQYTLQVKDLVRGTLLNERIERVTSAAWGADNQTLFYTVEDEETKRSYRLYRHTLGASGEDELIFEEKDERFRVGIERTRSRAFLLLTTQSHTASEVRYLAADQPRGAFRRIAEREEEHEYYVEHREDVFYIRTNSGGRNFRLAAAPVADPRRENWREVLAHRSEVMVAGVDAFATHLLLFEREGGLPYLRVVDLQGGAGDLLAASKRIAFEEPAYNAAPGANPEFATEFVRFHYESFVTPRSVYDYQVGTGERVLRKQQPVLGGYDSARYASERMHATAADGTKIPVSLVYRRDTPRDGSAPLLLYGYGSYEISVPVTFSSNRLSLLNRGMIYAVAHVRGGGELGKPWHDSGRMMKKRNTFTDFIAATEDLIARRYTAAERLVIEGGSAGGLLMGAVANLRPELFRIVISHVPFVDVLNTMLDASLPLTVGEYEEWGNPHIPEEYEYMKSYCPYTNMERKAYPTMLVKTSLHDSQVMYWEPAKYVAKLRTLKTDTNPLLLKTNMKAGHGGASGRYDYLREIAFDYAFLLTQLGIRG